MLKFLVPNWPAPKNINAYTTLRHGGFSTGTYESLNLAAHVEDNLESVEKNRELLINTLQLPSPPIWLQQIHCDRVILAEEPNQEPADGSYARQANKVCVVLTADCLPILICNKAGNEIAALHAGWRGIANGIIESGIKKMQTSPQDILVWFGPAMGPQKFEVGDDVRDIFINLHSEAKLAFQRNNNNRWLADIYLLARQRLQKFGITQIYGGEYCTYSDKERFFSYRRDKITGRMASLIWFT